MATKFGLIVGNRGFFPDDLARVGREEILKVLKENDCEVVALKPEETEKGNGSVFTRADGNRCAELFKKNADSLDGIIITLPNFGEERVNADILKAANLDIPVLVQASRDYPDKASQDFRRDSFCGKISTCNNLTQYGIPFSLTEKHTLEVTSDEFKQELAKFAGVCRVVKGLKNCRIGAIGARPAAFNTVRYSEKILEAHGISVETIDLSEIFGQVERLADKDPKVVEKLKAIKSYMSCGSVSEANLLKMAKLGVVIDGFIEDNELDATAVQCWTSMEEYFGVVPCTVMSMLSNSLCPSACEVDVGGALGMYALQLASGRPSALLDWNNNYGDELDKCVLFHCSNLPKEFFNEIEMDYQAIIAGSVGKENTYGTVVGRIKAVPMTFARFTTDDLEGRILTYVGEGEFTKDKFETFGGYGVAKIENLDKLMQFVCRNGFEHHVSVNLSSVADILNEAFTNYLGFGTYYHK